MAKRKPEGRLNGKKDNLNAFSLIEVFVVMTIVLIGLIPAVFLMVKTLDVSVLTLEKLTAAELAQEGVEIVRNIKDSKVISEKFDDWYNNLSDGIYYADYNDDKLTGPISSALIPYLKQDSDGFFNYDWGNTTSFKREIKIKKINDHHLKINSIVSWQHKGNNFNVNVESHLYKY